MTNEDHNAKQREYRLKTGNISTRKYEKTKPGFLMRAYRNMYSRVTGIQFRKFHLYAGKDLLPREEFYAWADASPEFHRLWDIWIASDYDRKLTPSVDRKDSALGYQVENMEWVTHSENSRRGSLSQRRKLSSMGRIRPNGEAA